MKTSTLLVMVTLSASCFAAPVHTALDSTAGLAADLSNAAPVAPAAPDFAAPDNAKPQHWEHIALPKSRHLERGFMSQDEHLQT